jgi:hypothetical protein
MEQLLTIEQNFLSLPTSKMGFNLTEVNKAKRLITNAQKSKFAHTMHLASCIKTAVEYFESPQCQALMQTEGISWNKEDLGIKVFGYQKSYFHKLLRASKVSEQILTAYNSKCDEIADAERSIAGLLEFSKNVNVEVSADATAEEIEEATAEAIESASIERTPTIFTMSFKNPNGCNVAVRIDADGKLSTTNSTEDIMNAIAFLQAQLTA